MKSFREGKGPPQAADLLICFPSRSHLTLMPKPVNSPANNHHRRRRSGGAGSHSSPILWAKTKAKDHNADLSEPTSPKVTCAGQIKIRPKPNTCKNWQSVMEKIEKMHNNKKQKKWIESFGFKKDVMQFLTCLRSIKFDLRCFGSYPTAEIESDDEEEGEEEEEDDHDQFEDASERREKESSEENDSETVFSKWFMILQESKDNQERKRTTIKSLFDEELTEDETQCAPPANALLLMRCRSAPAKSWLEEKLEEEEKSGAEKDVENEKEKENESLVVMTYGTDFSKFSSDIAKETWVVGGIKDLLSRSRSWKR